MSSPVVFKHKWLPVALIAPQLVITLVFFIWPAGQAIFQSSQLEDAFGMSREFVGLENFEKLIHDPLYLDSLMTTLQFSISVAVLALVSALVLSAFAEQIIRGATMYRTFLIWPYAVAPVVAGSLWLFLFDPTIGVMTELLNLFGVDWNPTLNGTHAMWMVIITSTWKQISYNFLFFLAALQSVPKSLHEAAAIDGSGPIKRFITISFPLISPTSFFLLVVNFVYAFFDTFAIIHAMTQGGPSNSTSTLVYKVYNDGFIGLDLGSSAAQSVILMILVASLTVIQFKYVEKKVAY
ncbi:sn-glycerol-3-phosphate ABC transporter permease UgpA [Vibrio owensii]|jgi:sn-glycerol 3-phosphate transport system permease protein|uniref:sn-glycerol-3-phosphate transport system permease protein UgpA n=3 Tax=Vibrio harveyi group TaxID=717610 RepID=A0AAP9GGI9_9VIBR|nr:MULTISPECIES: sn-glycerol-3-phosphate ABC transporter permease UgpA [Vibrio]KIP65702.1 glycerol-3-phosphate transporter permease [Vibrio harveyi]GAK21584.1 glycerol-3-phosphate ABC transporter, permease protein UgpA [Vibrio sp. JCM 19052]AYO17685.1 sn-glycerol-3-phosphate ABC transporter permease UgpA [Vibrio owensii]AYO23549.1 sn-glycerol-3-phosphate ABC transporter permease UgpA [Vibrio owensii]MCX2790608.1 sn-glycerol-3-phosphate ABC transporter permease UgpA [Vibrio sp. Sgm 5]